MIKRLMDLQLARSHSTGQVRGRRTVCARSSVLALLVVAGALTAGCDVRSPDAGVALPTTDPVSLRPYWAVVTRAYVRLLERPDDRSPIVAQLRMGDVAEITHVGTALYADRRDRYLWVEVRFAAYTGWLTSRDADLYATRARAENAAALSLAAGRGEPR